MTFLKKHWPILAALSLLLGIFALTLTGRWADCVVSLAFRFLLFRDIDAIQETCGELLNPFLLFR